MKCAFISYGLGGRAVEWWDGGLRELVKRCKAIGIETFDSPYHWDDVNVIVRKIAHLGDEHVVAVGGSSLGDNEAPDIARRVGRRIRYLFGFQCSQYGARVGVPANVDYADNIFNPSWLETFGLGHQKWFLAPGNHVTHLRNVPLHQPHPDDWGTAQDVVYSQIHRLLG